MLLNEISMGISGNFRHFNIDFIVNTFSNLGKPAVRRFCVKRFCVKRLRPSLPRGVDHKSYVRSGTLLDLGSVIRGYVGGEWKL